ncbi:MAG TPA: pantoate--beta-alanine ligase, partial [Rhizobiales bacterium]|nr:pantoate--beta-alanine ligase [Hyphomicrobiales bacterium]
RNAYLSPKEREKAPLLHQTISELAEQLANGGSIAELCETAAKRLALAGFEVDYLEVRNADNLAPVTTHTGEPARVFAAAMLGKTRLIDNVAVPDRKK